MPAPQIIRLSDLGLVEKKASIIHLLLSVDTPDTRETLQTQTDMSLQISWCGFVCLEKPSHVTLAVFFTKKNIIMQAIISVGTFLSRWSAALKLLEFFLLISPTSNFKQFSPSCVRGT